MPDDKTAELLTQEYLSLQKTVEEFDARALTIKAWSVTFSAAGLGLAYERHSRILLLIAAASALVFWLIEAMWKVNQQPFYRRIREIESHFRGTQTTVPMQTATAWFAAFRARGRYAFTLRILSWPHVALPHVLIALAGVALYLARPPV